MPSLFDARHLRGAIASGALALLALAVRGAAQSAPPRQHPVAQTDASVNASNGAIDAGPGAADASTRAFGATDASVDAPRGLLAPERIRRIVLANLGQVSACHERGLTRDPDLAGRVLIRFVIGGDGSVADSRVQESNLSVASVGTCIADAVRSWRFPPPEGGGVVTVNYPFNLLHPVDDAPSPDAGRAPSHPAPPKAPPTNPGVRRAVPPPIAPSH